MREEDFRLGVHQLSRRCLAGLLMVGLMLASGFGSAGADPQGQSFVMVGTTEVAQQVVWVNGWPADSVKVYGSGEAEDFVAALELLLPEGWTIWAPESFEQLNPADGERILWEGGGKAWPDVIEALAQEYGMEIIADVLRHRAVINVHSPEKPLASIMIGAQELEYGGGGNGASGVRASQSEHPLYREYVAPAQLSPEPLPDTIGRIAWRFVPVGVQIDLSALGVYVNAPVFQWDFTSVSVSPKAALETLLPAGYCLDEAEFPTVKAAICTSELPDSDAGVKSEGESDESAS